LRAKSVFCLLIIAQCIGMSNIARAQSSYPAKPIRIVVPSGPGGPNDIPARLASQILPPKFGHPVVVENRPGAAGAIGVREVAKAFPDGHTLLSAGGSQLTVLPALSASAGYDPTKDFAPIAKVMEAFQILVVRPSSPWRSVSALLDDARARPGKLNYAHIGTGHVTHLAGEMLMLRTGAKMVGVPYRGGSESVTALLSQTVDMTFDSGAILLPLIREGKLRGLATTGRTRSILAPDLPTMLEAGIPEYEITSFFGIVAPARVSPSIIHSLNVTINEGLNTREMRDTVTTFGGILSLGTSEDFAATIAADLHKWQELGKAANIRLD
jgi:tripartite-type tricarboxylate transporter receptor subunit TctC